MCGRFALTAGPADVAAELGLAEIEDFPPRYNIAPTQPILMVVGDVPRSPGSNWPAARATLVRWGFIPSWAKDPRDMPLLINARSETAAQKATFRAAMRHRRTLVPASGFYEWRRGSAGRSQPFWVRPRHGGTIAFAGLMETYSQPEGSEIDTGAILTTAASPDLADIHHRMPVVIGPQDYRRWLSDEPDPRDLMVPYPSELMTMWPVDRKVGSPKNNTPDIIDEIELEEPGDPELPL